MRPVLVIVSLLGLLGIARSAAADDTANRLAAIKTMFTALFGMIKLALTAKDLNCLGRRLPGEKPLACAVIFEILNSPFHRYGCRNFFACCSGFGRYLEQREWAQAFILHPTAQRLVRVKLHGFHGTAEQV